MWAEGLGMGSDLAISWVSFHSCLWDPWILLSPPSSPSSHGQTHMMPFGTLFALAQLLLWSRPLVSQRLTPPVNWRRFHTLH